MLGIPAEAALVIPREMHGSDQCNPRKDLSFEVTEGSCCEG